MGGGGDPARPPRRHLEHVHQRPQAGEPVVEVEGVAEQLQRGAGADTQRGRERLDAARRDHRRALAADGLLHIAQVGIRPVRGAELVGDDVALRPLLGEPQLAPVGLATLQLGVLDQPEELVVVDVVGLDHVSREIYLHHHRATTQALSTDSARALQDGLGTAAGSLLPVHGDHPIVTAMLSASTGQRPLACLP